MQLRRSLIGSVIVVLSSFAWCGQAGYGGIVDDLNRALDNAKNELKHAERQVDAAREVLARATDELKAAEKSLEAAVGKLDAQELVKKAKTEARNAALDAEQKARRAVVRLRRECTKLEDKVKQEITKALNKQVVLYDMTWTVSIEYNPSTRSFDIWADFPNGLKLTRDQIATALKEQNSGLPQIKPVEAVATISGFRIDKKCTFDDRVARFYRESKPNQRVWTSSIGLSECLSEEHLAGEAAKAYMSGGTTISGSLEEVAQAFLRDLSDAYVFLQDAVGDQADQVLPRVAEAILKQQSLDLREHALKVVTFSGAMTYRISSAGSSELEKYLPGIVKKDGTIGKVGGFHRPGFAIVVDQPQSVDLDVLLAGMRRKAKRFRPLDIDKLAASLPSDARRLVEPALRGQMSLDISTLPGLDEAFEKLDLEKCEFVDQTPLLDLSKSPLGGKIESLLRKARLGGDGAEWLKRLDLNVQTGRLVAVCEMHAREKVSLGEVLTKLNKGVKDLAGGAVGELRMAEKNLAKFKGKAESECQNIRKFRDKAERELRFTNQLKPALKAASAAQAKALAAANSASGAYRKAKNGLASAEDMAKHWGGEVSRLEQQIRNLVAQLDPRRFFRRLRNGKGVRNRFRLSGRPSGGLATPSPV